MGWCVPAVVFIAVVGGCSGLLFTPAGMLGAPLMAFFVAHAISRYRRLRRRQQAVSVLSYLENAVRLNLPLDPFLNAAVAAEHGHTRQLLEQVRGFLAQGYSPGVAVQAGLPDLPQEIGEEVVAAEAVGQLQPALSRRVEDASRPAGADEDLAPLFRIYPIGILFGLLVTMLGVVIYLIPKFRDIFKDFHMRMPGGMEAILRTANFLGNSYLGPTLVFAAAATLLLAVTFQLQQIIHPEARLSPPRRLRDWLAWRVPGWSAVERNRALAAVTQSLAEGTRAGLPLPAAIDHAMAMPVNGRLKDQLADWKRRTVAGAAPADAAAAAGLPAVLAGFLARDAGGRAAAGAPLADVFGFLARYYRGRFSAAVVVVRAAVEPLTVLLLGLLVGGFIYSIFRAMVALIQGVLGAPPGGTL
jgi:type IV pilus assembly protein PilC